MQSYGFTPCLTFFIPCQLPTKQNKWLNSKISHALHLKAFGQSVILVPQTMPTKLTKRYKWVNKFENGQIFKLKPSSLDDRKVWPTAWIIDKSNDNHWDETGW